MASAETNIRSPFVHGVAKRKPGAACVHCHRRKVRCDAQAVGFPCTNCRSSGKIDCRIHEKKKRPAVRSVLNPVPIRSRPPPATLAGPVAQGTTTTTTTTPTEFGLSHSPNGLQRTPADGDRRSLSSETNGRAPGLGLQNRAPQSQHQHQHQHQHQPPPPRQPTNPHEDRREMENRLVTLIDDQEPDSREIQRGVRAIYVGHDVSNMSFLLRQQRGDEGSYHFAGSEIPRRRLELGHDQFLQDALTLPDQALTDELVDAYFLHVNPGYPIVDEDQFMTQYRNRDPADPPPMLLLQAILLVGAHVARDKPEREELENMLYRRCKWLFDNRLERNRDILVQTALLLTWHSDAIDDDVSANAHYWVGVAARIATGLGMHRDPVSNKFAAGDRRTWRRVWWILVQYDVLISLSYGRPQAINLEDSDVRPLTTADFIGCGPHVQADFVIHFAELCSMISYIIHERFGLKVGAERRKAILPEADEALANWSLSLPDSLRLCASMNSWSAMLHLTYNNLLILLHRPHPKASAYSEDYGPHDAEICSAAASVITSIFDELRQKNNLKYVWCSGVFTLFTAMIQVRVELRFSNPVLAINALRRFDSTLYSLRCLADYWSSAETILRLFENSKKLQQDLRFVHEEVSGGQSSGALNNMNPPPHATSTTTTSSSATATATTTNQILGGSADASGDLHPHSSNAVRPMEDFQFSGSMLDDANNTSAAAQEPREYLDWKQLFPFTGLEQPVPMTMGGWPGMEDEWRQLYWEPQMSDLLQEGVWVQ